MTSIARLFSPDTVLLDLPLVDRPGLFEAVGACWSAHGGVDAGEVVRALQARESLGSTGLGQGVAIPHARGGGTAETLSAFVRPATPIAFDAPDSLPVDCFVCLLVPPQGVNEHLQLLAEIAQRLSSAAFRQQIRTARTPAEVNRLFAGDWEPSRKRG